MVYRGNGNENDGITAVTVINIFLLVKISIFKNYNHWMLKMILKMTKRGYIWSVLKL